jgi:hypothetical protein
MELFKDINRQTRKDVESNLGELVLFLSLSLTFR